MPRYPLGFASKPGVAFHNPRWISSRRGVFSLVGSDPLMPWVLVEKPDRPTFICIMHHHDIPAVEGYDRYVLVSRSQLPQVSHIAPWRVKVIPNGVDLRRFPPFSPCLANESGFTKRPFVVGRLSELREGKIPLD